jgi:hypothetical protein
MKRLYALLIVLPALMAFRPGTFEPEFFEWTPPTEYVDGAVLPAEDITAYLLDCTSNAGATVHRQTAGGLTSRYNVPANTFDAGTWTCTVKAVAALTSDPSLPVEFVVARYGFTVAPRPPVGLGVG